MEVAIRKMGNSKGVLIPKIILTEMGLENIAELQVRGDVIEIRAPRNEPRAGWAADAQRLSNTDEENLLWPEFGNADDADLKW